jgi:hypothetical protein
MVVECGYNPQWATYVPGVFTNIKHVLIYFNHISFSEGPNRSNWEGQASFNHPEKGVGWRQGGWYFIRSRADKSLPDDMSV